MFTAVYCCHLLAVYRTYNLNPCAGIKRGKSTNKSIPFRNRPFLYSLRHAPSIKHSLIHHNFLHEWMTPCLSNSGSRPPGAISHIFTISVAMALDSAKISLCTWDPICLPSDISLRRHQGILTRQYTDVTSSSAFRSTVRRNMLTAASDVSWKHAVAGTRTANNETRKSAQITQTSN